MYISSYPTATVETSVFFPVFFAGIRSITNGRNVRRNSIHARRRTRELVEQSTRPPNGLYPMARRLC